MSEYSCPEWCASLHDEEMVADRRHQSEVVPVAVVERVTDDAPAAEDLHLALFRFLEDNETWVGIEQLQITLESAHRLLRELTALLAQEGETHDRHVG